MRSLFLDAFYAKVRDRIILTTSWARHLIDMMVGSDKYSHVGLLMAKLPILVINKPRPVAAAAPAEQRDESTAPRWHLHIHVALLDECLPFDPQTVADDADA
jgi:hypothetical protein